MNFSRLAKYFSGKLPNSEKMDISEFVKILGNIDIEGDFISGYGAKFGSVKSDYEGLFTAISLTENGEKKIHAILEYLELSKSFLEMRDYDKYEVKVEYSLDNDISDSKMSFLKEYQEIIESLEDSKNNKFNGSEYENLIENFLLNSSYFGRGFTKEFKFEIGGQKIDKLLRLDKNILNISNPTLGYVVTEIKFKKEHDLSVNEVPQFESYIRILAKNQIAKYGIFVCGTDFKTTAIDKFKVILENENSNNQSFYIALITGKDIREFLENKGVYENMSFDEFIERSFIKWLK